MTKIPSDWVPLNCKIAPEANALIRPSGRRKGDISQIVSDAILEKLRPRT